MELTAVQRDRACGTLVTTAAGDALGAGYEFGAPLKPEQQVAMIGGGLGPFDPGEWTDDTSMAIAIAEIAATGASLQNEAALDRIVERWQWWARSAKDIGVQTNSVLKQSARHGLSARTAREAATALHEATGRTAGNGSLMRTAPVALAFLDDEDALANAARTISELTHFDADAGDACVLWCAAIRHAILTGELDVRIGLRHIDDSRRSMWAERLDVAETSAPTHFTGKNGWVVAALQSAWSAIATTPIPDDNAAAETFRADHLCLALEAAVRGGGDTDTVAAIAGGLLGAVHGASAVPWQWRLALKGWPGLNARGLVTLAEKIVDEGAPRSVHYPISEWKRPRRPVQHPHDGGLWLGGVAALRNLPTTVDLPKGVDVAISLCGVNDEDIRGGIEHLDVRLHEKDSESPHLDFVLFDTVRAVEQLRADGHTVYLHCEDATRRTPAVAALYGARKRGIGVDQALQEVLAALPGAELRPDLISSLHRLHPNTGSGK
ncbi:ADP-ribosylglycohydrolase family protein [Mycolicibacterium elephantis]